jgi:hypothetical protein
VETAGDPCPNIKSQKQITLEAAGIEPDYGQKPNRLTLRDFGRIGLQNRRLPTPSPSPPVPPSPLESPPVVEAFWRRQGRFPRPVPDARGCSTQSQAHDSARSGERRDSPHAVCGAPGACIQSDQSHPPRIVDERGRLTPLPWPESWTASRGRSRPSRPTPSLDLR